MYCILVTLIADSNNAIIHKLNKIAVWEQSEKEEIFKSFHESLHKVEQILLSYCYKVSKESKKNRSL